MAQQVGKIESSACSKRDSVPRQPCQPWRMSAAICERICPFGSSDWLRAPTHLHRPCSDFGEAKDLETCSDWPIHTSCCEDDSNCAQSQTPDFQSPPKESFPKHFLVTPCPSPEKGGEVWVTQDERSNHRFSQGKSFSLAEYSAGHVENYLA